MTYILVAMANKDFKSTALNLFFMISLKLSGQILKEIQTMIQSEVKRVALIEISQNA